MKLKSDVKSTEELVNEYYKFRGIQFPTSREALVWSVLEICEVLDDILRTDSKWTRNNPKEVSQDELEKEFGDVLMMLSASLISLRNSNVGVKNPTFTKLMYALKSLSDLYLRDDFNPDSEGYLYGVENYIEDAATSLGFNLKEAMIKKFESKGFKCD